MVTYKELSPNSKVWVYQSSRSFTATEAIEIQEQVNNFVQHWAAHGKGLRAFGKVYYQQFVVLVVEESTAKASGCSIDSSVHFLKSLGQKYKTTFFDRLLIAFWKGDKVITTTRLGFQELIAKGEVTDETIVFNNMVQTKADLESSWQIPLSASWHKQLVS